MKANLAWSLAVVAGAAVLLGAGVAVGGAKEPPDPAAKLKAGIREVVADPARAEAMVGAVDEIEAAVREIDALIGAERAALAGLLRDYRATRADVDASVAEFNARREPLARRVLTAHAGLKTQATPAEWKKLRKLELDMVTFAAARTLGQATPSGTER